MSAPEAEALFFTDGRRFMPTILSQGPWDPGHQFGGAAAALLACAVEATATLVPMQTVRLSIDLLRPVPIRPLTAPTQVIREGKRIQVVEATLVDDGGTEVARCTALRMRAIDLGADACPPEPPPTPLPPKPHDPGDIAFPDRDIPGISRAVEMRIPEGQEMVFAGPTWVRLRVPVLAGQPTLPLARLALVSDFASGMGRGERSNFTGINADISLHVVRPPEGEWIGMDGGGWMQRGGTGQSYARLSDDRGVVGMATLSRLVDLLPD